MSLIARKCPGCGPYGGPHLEGCPKGDHAVYNRDMKDDQSGTCVPPNSSNKSIELPIPQCTCGKLTGKHATTCPCAIPGVDVLHFVTGMTVAPKEFITEDQAKRPMPERVEIVQTIVPSTGTKLVCTSCGTQDWHTLILRRKAGLIEGLCKQEDGSGCYPLSSRRGCQYVYPNNVNCPQMAEYCVAAGAERRNEHQVCRDHIGEMMRQGPLYQVWPLED